MSSLLLVLTFCGGLALGVAIVVLNEWNWRRKNKFRMACPHCGDEAEIPYRDWDAAMIRVARFVGVHAHCHHHTHERTLQ